MPLLFILILLSFVGDSKGVVYAYSSTGLPASIYVWDLATPTTEFQPWTSFRSNSQNTSVLTLPNLIFIHGFA